MTEFSPNQSRTVSTCAEWSWRRTFPDEVRPALPAAECTQSAAVSVGRTIAAVLVGPAAVAVVAAAEQAVAPGMIQRWRDRPWRRPDSNLAPDCEPTSIRAGASWPPWPRANPQLTNWRSARRTS